MLQKAVEKERLKSKERENECGAELGRTVQGEMKNIWPALRLGKGSLHAMGLEKGGEGI